MKRPGIGEEMSDDMSDETGEINDYLDGRLTVPDRAAFEERMRRDPALARRVAEIRAIGLAIRESAGAARTAGSGANEGAGAPPLGDDFYARARERFESASNVVDLDDARLGSRRRFKIPWSAVGVAAACLILVAIFLPEGRMLPPNTSDPLYLADRFEPNAEERLELEKPRETPAQSPNGLESGTTGAPLSEKQRMALERRGEWRGAGLPGEKDEELKRQRSLGYTSKTEDWRQAEAVPPLPALKDSSQDVSAPSPAVPMVSGGSAGAARADSDVPEAGVSNETRQNEPLKSVGSLSNSRDEAKSKAAVAPATESAAAPGRKKPESELAKIQECLHFEPVVSRLPGVLLSRVFPGPPGYRSIEEGDSPVSAWLVQLDSPICVQGDPASAMNPQTVADVTLVQLEFSGPPEIEGALRTGARVVATGKLFTRHTGHHRTPVVLGDAQLVELN